jgi:hypothetical protein
MSLTFIIASFALRGTRAGVYLKKTSWTGIQGLKENTRISTKEG